MSIWNLMRYVNLLSKMLDIYLPMPNGLKIKNKRIKSIIRAQKRIIAKSQQILFPSRYYGQNLLKL